MSIDLDHHTELRRIARRLLRAERRNHTLAPTELVHEAWLRCPGSAGGDRGAAERLLAVRVMRQVLVDHARRRHAARRDARRGEALPFDQLDRVTDQRDRGVVALDLELRDLAEQDRELAAVVELRFFGGFEVPEVAALLGCSERTVKRRWHVARAWLALRVRDAAPAEPSR